MSPQRFVYDQFLAVHVGLVLYKPILTWSGPNLGSDLNNNQPYTCLVWAELVNSLVIGSFGCQTSRKGWHSEIGRVTEEGGHMVF